MDVWRPGPSYWLQGSIHRVGNDTGHCRVLSFRIRICRIMEDLLDCDDADASFYGYCLEASMTGPGWLFCLVVTPTCGYCLEASMTAPVALWIPAYAGMTMRSSFSPSAPVSGTGTGFDPLPSRERGIWLVLSCCVFYEMFLG